VRRNRIDFEQPERFIDDLLRRSAGPAQRPDQTRARQRRPRIRGNPLASRLDGSDAAALAQRVLASPLKFELDAGVRDMFRHLLRRTVGIGVGDGGQRLANPGITPEHQLRIDPYAIRAAAHDARDQLIGPKELAMPPQVDGRQRGVRTHRGKLQRVPDQRSADDLCLTFVDEVLELVPYAVSDATPESHVRAHVARRRLPGDPEVRHV
jgi:hypothetical protein